MDLYDDSLALPRKNQEDGHALRLEVFSPIPVKKPTLMMSSSTQSFNNIKRERHDLNLTIIPPGFFICNVKNQIHYKITMKNTVEKYICKKRPFIFQT